MTILRGLVLLAVTILPAEARAGQDEQAVTRPAPADSRAYRLELAAPITTWDEGIPLGNGLMGGLVWGEGRTINLSLDRGDLWDERLPEIYAREDWTYATIRKLAAAGNQAEISRLFDAPYNQIPYPTKLPGGRLVVTLAPGQEARAFSLDMRQAVGRVDLGDASLETFFCATEPVAMIRVGGKPPALEFKRPAGLDRLGYPPATFGRGKGILWMRQQAALGLEYAVVVGNRRFEDHTEIAVAITCNRESANPLAVGLRRVEQALQAGYEKMRAPHADWWKRFWAISSVQIPDAALLRHYNLVKFFYGAASRRGAPPMPLQGVWTRDDGNLPPWKGDYHNDLNTQMTYLAYHTAGLVESGSSFIDYQWNLLETYREFARTFYGVEGAIVPGVATLAGGATGGWSQYALSPTSGLWIGQTFYLHWRTTMDRRFLAERAYPWLSEVTRGVVNLCEGRDGKLTLPLSSSPEIHDNSIRAWLEPNSNYDLALMQWALGALTEMAQALGKQEDAAHWRTLRGRLDKPAVDDEQVLMFARGEPFAASHRHHSHAMAIYPLGTLKIDGTPRDRAVINATLDRMESLGTAAWVGYSFSWFACMLARAGRAEEALHYLQDYRRAFLLRNGFHANGDQIGAGLSSFSYRPFTLEGNFLAMQAIHEMLLQSAGGRVHVFPAVSATWKEVSFERLRAAGGFIVSAERRNGLTRRVEIIATVDQRLRLKNPFDSATYTASQPSRKIGGNLLCDLRAGGTLVLERK